MFVESMHMLPVGRDGYFVLDISNLEKITEIGRESSPSDAQVNPYYDDYVYIADDFNWIEIIL